jgi:hypothetical protein
VLVIIIGHHSVSVASLLNTKHDYPTRQKITCKPATCV